MQLEQGPHAVHIRVRVRASGSLRFRATPSPGGLALSPPAFAPDLVAGALLSGWLAVPVQNTRLEAVRGVIFAVEPHPSAPQGELAAVALGLGRIDALHYLSSTSHQIC